MPLVTGTADVEGLHGANEDAANELAQLGVANEEEANVVGEAEYPLADGNLGEYVVDQVSRDFGHAAAGTRWAHRPCLARESDQHAVMAAIAVHANEPSAEDSARQEPLEFSAHVTR